MSIIALQNSQPHPRRAIREKVKSLMKENTDLAGRWFCSRPKPAFVVEIPCGLIYFTDENADHENTAPRTYKRECMLVTEVLLQGETERENSADDFLDSRAFEIEAAMLHDRFLGFGHDGPVEDVQLVRTQPTVIKYEGEVDIESIRIFWKIDYRTDAWTDSQLDEFLRFIAEHDSRVGDSIASAEDHVTIREA